MSFNFTWAHPANEVYVTGTFDNWAKTERLEKTAHGFEKVVSLPKTDEKILYKFVADGSWTTDHTAPTERDHDGNVNNVLTPDRIQHPSTASSAISSAAPGSTSAAMAGQQPHEKSAAHSELPGSFPETPAVETSKRNLSLGGGDETNTNTNTNEPSFGVAPIPATGGASNPVKLAPGEKVPEPSTYTDNTLDNNVRLDKESYEKSDAGAPQLPPVLDSQEQREANGAAMFSLPSAGGTMIPESSLPMGSQDSAKDATSGGPHISSVSPQSTTAQLAGQQPIAHRGVPEVVSESQQEAGFDPEASNSDTALAQKDQLEEEIKDTVPEVPPTSESGTFGKSERGITGAAVGGVAAGGAAIAAAAYHAKDKATESTGGGSPASNTTRMGSGAMSYLPQSVQNAISQMNSGVSSTSQYNSVPDVVTESQREAHVSPEAAASPEAVREKSAVENELLREVTPVQASGDPTQVHGTNPSVPSIVTESQRQAHVSPEAAASSEAVREKSAVENELLREVTPAESSQSPASGVPSVVTESQRQAHVDPEAAASTEAVREKSAVENELLQEVRPAESSQNAAYGVPSVVTESQRQAHVGPEAAASADAVREKSAVENELLGEVKPTPSQGATSGVPSVVTESQRQAHVGPEAAASPEAVREKSAVENELLKEVTPTEESGEPAPSQSAALSSSAPTQPTTASTASPDSKLAAGAGGIGALAGGAALGGVAASSGTKSGLNAPASAQAQTPATKSEAERKVSNTLPAPTYDDSRDVSPMSKPTTTTGTDSFNLPTTSEATSAPVSSTTDATPVSTPQKSRPESTMFKNTLNTPDSNTRTETSTTASPASATASATTGDAKKKNRRSFFGKLKDKLKS